MGTRNDAKEIAKLATLADNEQATPLVQIAAARKLLRFTNFSARSCRVGKRTANRWLAAEAVSQSIRNRAALLLNFTLERKFDTPSGPEEATEPTAFGPSPAPLVSPKRSVIATECRLERSSRSTEIHHLRRSGGPSAIRNSSPIGFRNHERPWRLGRRDPGGRRNPVLRAIQRRNDSCFESELRAGLSGLESEAISKRFARRVQRFLHPLAFFF